jgi:hypothetical protein
MAAANESDSLAELITMQGLEQLGRFYGVYRAIVVRVDDPEARGRIQAICPQAGHAKAPDVWVYPAQGAGDGRGIFWPPEVGDSVYVTFENGWPGAPRCYFGGWYARDELPAEFSSDANSVPRRRGVITRGGHALIFDDTVGGETITLSWHAAAPGDEYLADPQASADRTKGKVSKITFDSGGGITVLDMAGSRVKLDGAGKVTVQSGAAGAKVTLTADKAEVDAKRINHGAAADQAHLRGNDFRSAQKSMNSAIQAVGETLNGLMATMAGAAAKAATSPAMVFLAADAAASLAAMGAAMGAAAAQFQTLAQAIAAFEAASASYLSPVTFTK